MRGVVDTNIVFSAILNSSSNIGKVLIHLGRYFEFYSCHFLLEEIQLHKKKLKQISGLSDALLSEAIRLTTTNIRFINEELLPEKDWAFAANVLSGSDHKDIPLCSTKPQSQGTPMDRRQETFEGFSKGKL
jgi:predicted nucleic acid-binding protein